MLCGAPGMSLNLPVPLRQSQAFPVTPVRPPSDAGHPIARTPNATAKVPEIVYQEPPAEDDDVGRSRRFSRRTAAREEELHRVAHELR